MKGPCLCEQRCGKMRQLGDSVGKKQILIVEDDRETQILLKKRLEGSGFQCISAYTVESALEMLGDTEPSLVILDLGLPKASGIAFLTSVKQWLKPGRKVPPIIVLTGYNDKEIVDMVLDKGASGFLSKPIDPNLLTLMVGDYAL